MPRGFVYIATNESMPGIVKIGRSSRVPEKRMDELSNTSVPTPFVCFYYAFVEDNVRAEEHLHNLFQHKRISRNREFFRIEPYDAIKKIRTSLELLFEDPDENSFPTTVEMEEKSKELEKQENEARQKEIREKVLLEDKKRADLYKKYSVQHETIQSLLQKDQISFENLKIRIKVMYGVLFASIVYFIIYTSSGAFLIFLLSLLLQSFFVLHLYILGAQIKPKINEVESLKAKISQINKY